MKKSVSTKKKTSKKKVVVPNNDYSKKELLSLTDNQLNEKVIIKGTKFDRNRNKVITPAMVNQMQRLIDNGLTPLEVAKKLGCTTTNVRYYTDKEFNEKYRERRRHTHYGKYSITDADRAAYKRKLVTAGAKLFVK